MTSPIYKNIFPDNRISITKCLKIRWLRDPLIFITMIMGILILVKWNFLTGMLPTSAKNSFAPWIYFWMCKFQTDCSNEYLECFFYESDLRWIPHDVLVMSTVTWFQSSHDAIWHHQEVLNNCLIFFQNIILFSNIVHNKCNICAWN